MGATDAIIKLLKPGDEVVATKQDYPNMINAYKQRELRDGIKMVWISLDLPSEDEDYMVNKYVSAFTPKTKVVHITHIINWNGQILPVKKIAAEARGVVLYLRQREHSLDLVNQLRTYNVMQESGLSKREASLETGYGVDRDYGVGAQILHDLGLRQILLLSNHPPKVAALEGFELTVVGNVPLGEPACFKDQETTTRLPQMNKKE